MFRLVIGLILIVFVSTPVGAAGRPWLPSKADSVNQSLDSLLNSGWEIIQGSMGFEGFVVTLKNGDKYILCEWAPRENGQSRCYALN